MSRGVTDLASRLRKRVTLQSLSLTADGGGGAARGWQDVATLWAEVVPLRGAESLQAEKVTAEITHLLRLRYRSDVTPDKRLLLGGRALNIRAVLNVGERGRELEVYCEEGAAT